MLQTQAPDTVRHVEGTVCPQHRVPALCEDLNNSSAVPHRELVRNIGVTLQVCG